MRINIASSGGRFHLLDLARELHSHGHEVHFYSFVPDKRAIKFGLPKECNNTYFHIALPFLVLLRLTKRARWVLYLFHRFFDYYTAWIMKPCDVFIAHSPMHVYAIEYARTKYGAKIILERGTSHVLTQIEVLKQNPAAKGKDVMPKMFLKRDLRGYELADYIVVGSDHVMKSFVKNGIPKSKLFRNPYGAKLQNFHPTELLKDREIYDVIMIGQWCHRKGCDLLYQACKELNVKFCHVGPLVDLPFEESDSINHFDAVDETELIKFYEHSRIFALASREEGLAMVQPQAVLCGLPVVCSPYTGGRDLRDLLCDRKWIMEFPEMTVDSIKEYIQKALDLAKTQVGVRNYAGEAMNNLTWKAYGDRYNTFLEKIK